MMPTPGFYRLTLPPFPWPIMVEVVAIPFAAIKCALGTFPYSLSYDTFSLGPESGIECLGSGTFRVTINGVAAEGTCVPA